MKWCGGECASSCNTCLCCNLAITLLNWLLGSHYHGQPVTPGCCACVDHVPPAVRSFECKNPQRQVVNPCLFSLSTTTPTPLNSKKQFKKSQISDQINFCIRHCCSLHSPPPPPPPRHTHIHTTPHTPRSPPAAASVCAFACMQHKQPRGVGRQQHCVCQQAPGGKHMLVSGSTCMHHHHHRKLPSPSHAHTVLVPEHSGASLGRLCCQRGSRCSRQHHHQAAAAGPPHTNSCTAA